MSQQPSQHAVNEEEFLRRIRLIRKAADVLVGDDAPTYSDERSGVIVAALNIANETYGRMFNTMSPFAPPVAKSSEIPPPSFG